MDEKIDQVLALAGNEHRYQYFTLVVIIFLWVNCNFISCVLPFLEREPIVNYTDSEGNFHENVTLTSDICMDLNGRNFTVVESFGYSWASEFHIECKNAEIGNIGSFAFIGNAAGGFVFSFISKLISHKKILIISSFGFCIAIFLCTTIRSFDYFYGLLVCEIFMGLFGNCLCYSSLVVAQEIVASKKRSLFNSIINVGYAFCGIIYAILFLLLQDWRKVFYVLIGASAFTLILIWIFIYDSPREYFNSNNYDKVIKILEGIASFNGKLEEFREGIEKDEEIKSIIKGEPLMNPSERPSKADTKEKNKEEENINENNENSKEYEFNKDISEGKLKDINLTTSLISQGDNNLKNSLNSEKKNRIQKINVWSLFKYPSIRYRFLLLNFLWIGTRASFNGVSISSKAFPGNFYVNIIVLFILESISYFVSGYLIDIKKLGRKGTLWIEYALVIIVFVLLAFLELDTAGSLTLNYLARFCCAGIDVIYYTYSIELYPTPVRSLAFGINATFGNAGSIGAPYLLEFLKNWQFLILFGVVCAINAVVLVCIPETVGKPMIESIKELSEENNIDTLENNIDNVENNKNEEADDLRLDIKEDNNNEEKTEDMKGKQEN
jgi:MFS family permease